MRRATRSAVALGILFLLGAATASAQWITIGRKAIGKIKEMTQSEKTGGAGYSVATVLVAGEADKVYATAVRSVQANPKLRLTRSAPEKRSLELADGERVVGIEVTQVGEGLVHLVAASTTKPGAADETSLVVAATLRICKEMGAECSVLSPEKGAETKPAGR